MTIFPDYYLRGRRKKRDRENLFLARIFQKFRPTASILLSCILLASIIFASLATYSRNATPTCRCVSVAHRLHFRTSRTQENRQKDIAEWWKCVRLPRTRKARGNKARSAAATKEVAKSTVWTAVTALCFDSILLAVLHFPPAGMAVGISHRDCRVFKFIYFPSFDVFYSLRFPWSQRSQLQRLWIPEIDCTIFERSLKRFQQSLSFSLLVYFLI